MPEMNGRPATTAEMLAAVAKWLDLADDAFQVLAEIRGVHIERGTTVQADLLLMAEWLRQHPDIDAQMHAVCDAIPGT